MALKNKAAERAYQAKWRSENREWIRNWRATHSTIIKKHATKNKVKNLHLARLWRLSHIEYSKKKRKEYLKKHPEQTIIHSHKRRALKAGSPIKSLAEISKWIATWRSKRTAICYWCQNRVSVSDCHTDHIVAIGLGGAHMLENLCISCKICNSRKHSKTLAVWSSEIIQPVLLL